MIDASMIVTDWHDYLKEEFDKDYMVELNSFLVHQSYTFPPKEDIFTAFNMTPLKKVKVVIIGQDPYHGEGQAHGLAFSVKKDVKTPPSLKNIYKELNDDLGVEIPTHGNLEAWAKQGVLMINNVLTVEQGKAGSHQKKGWEKFTDKVISIINEHTSNTVFLLWGSPAQKKASKVDETKHLLLKSVHPSPLSAYRGFFGCKHFSKTNDYLKLKNKSQINWQI
jgi:uracil-DNA glycosylase